MSIFIVRHGQSVGNLDLKNYNKIADHAFELTDLGIEQALQAGRDIVNACNPEPGDYDWKAPAGHMMWISPFRRARETAEVIQKVFDEDGLYLDRATESPLIIEKQYGLYNQIAGHGNEAFKTHFPRYDEEYQKAVEYDGRFFSRPPGGESDFDVLIRAEIFWEKLRRIDPDLEYDHTVVCHGTTMRILAMAFMDKPYEWFQRFKLPHNGEVIVPFRGHLSDGKYTPFHE
jgi:broad specificity phosphatase PhoE